MASIGRITGALIGGTLEPSLALANLHFDFTLIKVDAPREFAGVGSQLSAQRRNNAEAGPSHVLARKLGALFRDFVPSTPELVKAYGSRASSIFNSTVADNQGGALHGFFAGLVGADATSMWAAATSGKHAIACHLLACLLARMWDAPEATSYWMELVTRRKQEICAENEQLGDPTLAIVSRESFQRQELAEWDASARAWLRVADSAMALRQTQVRLILDNITLSVNSKADTYESILEAWKSSLQQMEGLLVGHPQEARDGAIILGLYSWHLYPDMIVLASEEKTVKQNDPLFEGRGILTVGLTRKQASDCRGVYWSLPLRYLRYYGLPVPCERSLSSSKGTRITIDQLLSAWTAAYIVPWNDGTLSTEELLAFFSKVINELRRARGDDGNTILGRLEQDTHQSWLEILFQQTKLFLESANTERKVLGKIWKLGMAHSRMFSDSEPFFNIFTPDTFLSTATELEDKVYFLRRLVKELKPTSQSSFIIRYRYHYHSESKYEYATAVPQIKRLLFDEQKENHTRWIWSAPRANEETVSGAEQIEDGYDFLTEGYNYASPEVDDPWAEHHTTLLTEVAHSQEQEVEKRKEILEARERARAEETERAKTREVREARERYFASKGENTESVETLSNLEGATYTQVVAPGLAGWYIAVLGDESCQLLERTEPSLQQLSLAYDKPYSKTEEIIANWAGDKKTCIEAKEAFGPRLKDKFTTKLMREFFRVDTVSFQKCAQLLLIEIRHSSPALLALRGMSTIAALYEGSQPAIVDVRSVALDLTGTSWLISAKTRENKGTYRTSRPLGSIELNYAASFACIAMMESGRFDLNPEELESVTALSCGDSLYVPSSLLRDPGDNFHQFHIRRLTGNIGRAGFAFLVPPSDPMVRSYDALDDWQLVDYAEFDGRLENNFASTSLQLSFTEATLPLNLGFSGSIDNEAYFVETLISVHDSGQWVADLDVLKALKSTSVHRVVPCADVKTDVQIPKYVSIDRFAEMLCQYKGIGIVRAWGNWQARLAATAICVAKGHRVIVSNDTVCWKCIEIQVDAARNFDSGAKVVVIS